MCHQSVSILQSIISRNNCTLQKERDNAKVSILKGGGQMISWLLSGYPTQFGVPTMTSNLGALLIVFLLVRYKISSSDVGDEHGFLF